MSNAKQYEKAFAGLMALYETEQDSAYLIKMYEMIRDEKIKVTGQDKSAVGFLAKNRGDGPCSRCKAKCYKDHPVFFQNGKRWCENCATETEKECSFYQNYTRKLNKPATHQDKVNELMVKADAEIAAKKAGYLDDEDE